MKLPSAPARPRRNILLPLVVILWVGTMAQLARSELSRADASPDVAELIDSARLRKMHVTASHEVFFGAAQIGHLDSTVSGGQRDGQLLYTIKGELGHPFAAELKGFVLADWERHPERFVIELTWSGQRHRFEGQFSPGDASSKPSVTAEYASPETGAEKRRFDMVLAAPAQLAPGALPLPSLRMPSGATTQGVTDASLTGQPMPWSLATSREDLSLAAGHSEVAMRHALTMGAFDASLWLDREGQPLQVELPFGLLVRRAVEDTEAAAP